MLAAGCSQFGSDGYYDPPNESTTTDAQYQGQGAGYRSVVHAPSQVQIDLKRDAPRKPASGSQDDADAAYAASGQPASSASRADTPVPPLPPGGANARMVAHADAEPAPAAAPSASKNAAGAATDTTATNTTEPADAAARALIPQAQTYMGTFPCFSRSMQCQAQAQRVTLTLAPNGRWRARTTVLESEGKPTAEQGCWSVTGERPARLILLDAQGNTRAELLASANNVLRLRSVLGNVPTLDYRLTRQPDLDPIDELVKQPAPACH